MSSLSRRKRASGFLQLAIIFPSFVIAQNFNEAVSESIISKVIDIVSAPWIPLGSAAAAFDSDWCVKDPTVAAESSKPWEFVDLNNSRHLLWTLMKPYVENTGVIIDGIQIGLPDGAFVQYRRAPRFPKRPLIYSQMSSRNQSCLPYLEAPCRVSYENSTDPVSGLPVGPPSIYNNFDTSLRPWYLGSLSTGDTSILHGFSHFGTYGAMWTEPYALYSQNVLGITASRQIRIRAHSIFVGVVGANILLSTIDQLIATFVSEAGKEFVAFVVDDKGLMISSSVDGLVLVSESGVRISALDCTNAVIADVASRILNPNIGGYSKANDTIYTVEIKNRGIFWFQCRVMKDAFGLHWHVITVEPMSCITGTYVHISGVCRDCPIGATCLGGSILPYPKFGYWLDRSMVLSEMKIYQCVRRTCAGFEQLLDLSARKYASKKGIGVAAAHVVISAHLSKCWLSNFFFNSSFEKLPSCTQFDDLMCDLGSSGPLCGSCMAGFTFEPSSRICKSCNGWARFVSSLVFVVLGVMIVSAVVIKKGFSRDKMNKIYEKYKSVFCMRRIIIPIAGFFSQVDRGMLKVVWVTAQIISTIGLNIEVTFPEPFRSGLQLLSFTQFDISAFGCVIENIDLTTRCLLAALVPIGLILLNGLFYLLRLYRPWSSKNRMRSRRSSLRLEKQGKTETSDERSSRVASAHIFCALLLSYVVLPTDCIDIGGVKYLAQDTSIKCSGSSYERFVILDYIFIFIFQSVPLVWLVILWRVRRILNPATSVDQNEDRRSAVSKIHQFSTSRKNIDLRCQDPQVAHLAFLWKDYKPTVWYFEVMAVMIGTVVGRNCRCCSVPRLTIGLTFLSQVLEMYRRITFVSILPLMGRQRTLRPGVGFIISLIGMILVQGTMPFKREATNVLLVTSLYQINLTFFTAFAITSGAVAELHLDPFALGALLLTLNGVLVAFALFVLMYRWREEEAAKRWRKLITDEELDLVARILMGNDASNAFSGTEPGVEMNGLPNSKVNFDDGIGQHLLLRASEIKLLGRIGCGSFGEVFHGQCGGQEVAVKTMLEINEANLLSFRAEILLTSSLHHMNIVNFVGACWGRDLTCLVLEWVPKGSLGDILRTTELEWGEPLLRFSQDICRGMHYLHSRRGFDETTGKLRECVIHRDLKPDNCLVTNFASIKISDFGSSRSKAEMTTLMTAVGTPLFSAPEVAKGCVYDEKVDVYSFGMTLINMAVQEPILSFIGKRWASLKNKSKAPKSPMVFIRAMVEENWRPVSAECSISFAPTAVNELIVRCMDNDPTKRPSFESIVDILAGPAKEEIEQGSFFRSVVGAGRQKIAEPSLQMGGSPLSRASEGRAQVNLVQQTNGVARNSDSVNDWGTRISSGVEIGASYAAEMQLSAARRLAHALGNEATGIGINNPMALGRSICEPNQAEISTESNEV